ncbi:MAG: heat-shock protein, partial [Candidatus Nealsonbacteria bacterium CG18_big_fil_WC_8_21_14_2_50_37_10]
EFVDISFERDIIIIRGKREKPSEEKEDYFSQECYWGPFSREIILPVEVDPNLAEATMKEGILTIRLPKIEREKKRVIKVRA